MKITITSADIEKMTHMTADERVAYLEAKMMERKSARLSWMRSAFDRAFGI